MKLAYSVLIAAVVSVGAQAQQATPAQPDAQQPPSPAFNGTEPPAFTMPDGTKVFRLDPKGPLLQFGPHGPSFVIQWPSCPVSMEARQGMDGGMVKVRDRATGAQLPDMKPGQLIHLILGQVLNGKKIVAGTVRVSGLSARTRRASSDLRGSLAPDVWRTLQVTFTPEIDGNVGTQLKLPGFTSVMSVRLISITYDDGSEWRIPPTNRCSARPDPLMRIAER